MVWLSGFFGQIVQVIGVQWHGDVLRREATNVL